jgi:hypothetical protein
MLIDILLKESTLLVRKIDKNNKKMIRAELV